MDKTYLILGASSDTAISYIKHLDEKLTDCTVYGFCRSSANRLSELELTHVRLIPIVCDLSDIPALDRCLEELSEQGVKITHFLHFAAGKLVYEKASKFSAERLEENFRIQVTSAAEALKYILPMMKKQKFGRVVITTSSCTIGTPPKYMSEYTVVKYALHGLIKSYAAEFFGKNITINGIAPAMMETRFWDTVSPHIAELTRSVQPGKQCIPQEELHKCLDYLTSDEASFVTGENINLSGGQVM